MKKARSSLSRLKETDKVIIKGKSKRECLEDGNIHRQEILKETPLKYHSSLCPLNLEEEKQRFLTLGLLPRFQLKQGKESVEAMMQTKRKFQIRFDLFNEAARILDTVKQKYGDGDRYLHCAYGEPIHCPDASEIIYEYLKENAIDDNLQVLWSNDISCSGRMTWHGPALKKNRPEERKYTLWLKNSTENAFLREKGITCLADHEIGTHYFRMCNDGLQPWFASRDKFGIKSLRSYQLLRTEEGLATINTVLNARVKYLWYPALLYFSACMASEMTFKELFDHLAHYIRDDEQRWKHVMRIKRGLQNPNDLGGCGKDQCYFEGAIDILRQLDSIDFRLLMAGKICLEDLPRVKRMARQDCIKIPLFMRDMQRYRRLLKQIAQLNGIPTDGDKRERNIVPSTNFDVFLHKVKTGQLMAKIKPSPREKVILPNKSYVHIENQQQQQKQQLSPRSLTEGASDCPTSSSSSGDSGYRQAQQSASSSSSPAASCRRISGRNVSSTKHSDFPTSNSDLNEGDETNVGSQRGRGAVASMDATRRRTADELLQEHPSRPSRPWRQGKENTEEGDEQKIEARGGRTEGVAQEKKGSGYASRSPSRKRPEGDRQLKTSKQALVTELYSARSARRVSNFLTQRPPQHLQLQQQQQSPQFPTRQQQRIEPKSACARDRDGKPAQGPETRRSPSHKGSSLTRARSLSRTTLDERTPKPTKKISTNKSNINNSNTSPQESKPFTKGHGRSATGSREARPLTKRVTTQSSHGQLYTQATNRLQEKAHSMSDFKSIDDRAIG